MRKAMLFIDGSNLYFDWKTTASPGKNMDLEKLIKTIVSKSSNTDLKRSYSSYNSKESISQSKFIEKIKRIPRLDVCYGRLQKKPISIKKDKNIKCPKCSTDIEGTITTYCDKGTDVNLAVDMLTHAFKKNYEVAFLLSRDADFVKAVKTVKDIGVDVELVIFKDVKDKACELWESVDDWIVLDKTDCDKSSL